MLSTELLRLSTDKRAFAIRWAGISPATRTGRLL